MPDQPMTRPAPAPSDDGGSATTERSSTLRFILKLAILAWVVRSLIIAPFSIPSGSMLPTLYIGDYLDRKSVV